MLVYDTPIRCLLCAINCIESCITREFAELMKICWNLITDTKLVHRMQHFSLVTKIRCFIVVEIVLSIFTQQFRAEIKDELWWFALVGCLFIIMLFAFFFFALGTNPAPFSKSTIFFFFYIFNSMKVYTCKLCVFHNFHNKILSATSKSMDKKRKCIQIFW